MASLSLPAIKGALENIYISPLETCNLNCRLCYTQKSPSSLSNRQITSFIRRYRLGLASLGLKLKSVLFCGGEVFARNTFPRLINRLNSQGLFVSLITNGTIDLLSRIRQPSACQLLVSLDGPPPIHDANRGLGSFQKTLNFILHATTLGFPLHIMFLVTPDSYPYLPRFSRLIKRLTGQQIPVSYITLKSLPFTKDHPLAQTKQPHYRLTPPQIVNLKRRYPSHPPRHFGCFQLSLQSNGLVYGCCESPTPLASLRQPIKKIVASFLDSLSVCSTCRSTVCHGCTDPHFLCGYKTELSLSSCQQVVKSFNRHGQK